MDGHVRAPKQIFLLMTSIGRVPLQKMYLLSFKYLSKVRMRLVLLWTSLTLPRYKTSAIAFMNETGFLYMNNDCVTPAINLRITSCYTTTELQKSPL